MIVVGECESEPPKEQVSKRPLKPISQVEELQQDASLESVFIKHHQRGSFAYTEVKLSGKRTEKGK
jgi:hypothetical protein